MSWSASSSRMAGARPRRCSTASRPSPASRSSTRATCLAEMDLDAILKRRPQLVLVDELAHTNAPGSRHPKRYLDVEELIAAGIDVFATLNIQHVESLNDVDRPDHPDPGARDRARQRARPGRRHRGHRPLARGPDQAPARGQGLCAAAGRARGPPFLLDRQSDGVARAGVAPHRPARRRAIALAYARACDLRARGRPASGCWSASARRRAPRG